MTVEAGTVPAVGTPDAGWARLSPLTPLLRSGRFLLVVIAVLTQQGLRQPDPRLLLGALAVALPVTLLLGWLSWRATRYRVTDAELQVDSGVLQRRNRRVPLARLQSVDVVRPLLARALGLAELRLEVVGGGSTEAPLAYLPEADAQRLRLQLLALAAGERAEASAPDAAEPPEQLLVQVPTQALVVSVLLGAPVVVLGVLVLAVVGLLLVEPQLVPGLVVGLVPLVLGTGGMVVRRLLAEYGFTVAESADGLRLRHGLLETRAQTIPPGRVQTVRITEPLLWRRRGWVRVEVDVAGYAGGGGEEQARTAALLPVAPRDFALALVARVLGGAVPPATAPVPRSARLRAPLQVPRLRIGLDGDHLVTASGVLTTTTDIAPLGKVQSLRLVQGPWQRSLGLATLHADTAGRRLTGAAARHRDADEAGRLLVDLRERIRLARRRPAGTRPRTGVAPRPPAGPTGTALPTEAPALSAAADRTSRADSPATPPAGPVRP